MELINADEWDLHRRQNRPPPPEEDEGWQEVTAKPNKGKGKQQSSFHARNGDQSSSAKATTKGKTPIKSGNSRRRWQDFRGKALQPPAQPPKPKLIDHDEEDAGQDRWRALEPAKAFIRIPGDLVLKDDSTLFCLAKQNRAFVSTDQRPSAGGETLTFGIWAKGSDAEKAKAAINAWIEESMGGKRSNRSAKFAKVQSWTPVLQERAEKRWKREVQRQRFRQHPPPDMAFGAIGTFHWPVKEYNPQEILGTNYEALDPIRMDCACYVVWKKNSFQVMGRNMETIKAATLRLRRTVFQIAAKQLPPLRTYLSYWPNGSRSDAIHLQDYERPRQLAGPGTDEVKQHPAPIGQGFRDEHNEAAAVQTRVSEKRTYESIMRTLSKLPYHRGSVRMRFHFGRFVATQYMLPENGRYSLQEYESMVKESQFQGLTTDELGDREMEQGALSALRDADSILIPLDPMVAKLRDVKPLYSATFTFADKHGILRLAKSWEPVVEDGSKIVDFNEISQKWERLDRETGTTSSLVDISLNDLTTSFGWAFTMEAAQTVEEERIDAALVTFARNLKIDAEAARRHASDRPFVKFNSYVPNAALKSVEQRITYRFGMRDLDYNVELTRFQTTAYGAKDPGSSVGSTASQPKVIEPRWGVTVHSVEWDTTFAENEQLGIGQKTAWGDDSRRWFPKAISNVDDEDERLSFYGLLAKLQEVGTLLRSAKVEDLMGGMSIG